MLLLLPRSPDSSGYSEEMIKCHWLWMWYVGIEGLDDLSRDIFDRYVLGTEEFQCLGGFLKFVDEVPQDHTLWYHALPPSSLVSAVSMRQEDAFFYPLLQASFMVSEDMRWWQRTGSDELSRAFVIVRKTNYYTYDGVYLCLCDGGLEEYRWD